MRFYDFIEIGTSDFDTEIQKDNPKVGISIEPIKYYLDRLPNKENCIKLNMAISNYEGVCLVHYLSEKTIKDYNFPDFVRGCNSINSYHKTIQNLCKQRSLDIEKISEEEKIGVTTLFQIMNKLNIHGVYFLKIDTEGHDTAILKKFIEENQNNRYLPHVILFESNTLSNKIDVDTIIELFIKKGYDLIQKDHDTLLKLNLKKLENKKEFSEKIHKYYIMEYPPNYNIHNLPHENTFESAKEYCIKYNCSGITFQDGIYQVRNGKYMNYFDGDIYSWVYL